MAGETRLRIDIGRDEGAGAEELDEATRALREELLELDVEDVQRPAGAAPPPGTRGLELAAIGSLLVSLGHDALPVVLNAVARWVSRRDERSVTLELDGDRIELKGATAEDQRRLIDAFVARHAGGEEEWRGATP